MRIDYRRPASLAFSTNHLVELAGATLAASMDQTTPMQIDETAAVDRTAAIQPMIATENDDLADRRQRTMTLLQNSDRISSTQKEILAKLIEVGDPAVLSSINIRFTDEEIVAVLENLARLQNSSCDIDNQIDTALRVIYKDADNKKKQNSAKSSFRHIRKIIEKVHKCPSDIKARRVLVKNFTFKKFISDVPGALELMKELGFVSVNEDCLEIDQNVDVDFLARTMVKLDQAASDMDAALASTSDDQGPRKPCVGNCGFFGNPDTEGFCSLCFRQKLSGKDPIVEKTECISDGCNNFGNPSKDHYCNKCWQEREDIKNAGWSNRSWWRPLQRAKLKLHAVWLFRQGRASRPVQLDLRKCWMCTRKVPLSAVACQCGYVFCSKHRSTLDHECTFNFRRAHKVHLHQLNPQIQGKKFDRLD